MPTAVEVDPNNPNLGGPDTIPPDSGSDANLLLPAVQKGGAKGIIAVLIGLLSLLLIFLMLLILAPASLDLKLFSLLGLDPEAAFGDGSVMPACDGSVMPQAAGDGSVLPAVQDGMGEPPDDGDKALGDGSVLPSPAEDSELLPAVLPPDPGVDGELLPAVLPTPPGSEGLLLPAVQQAFIMLNKLKLDLDMKPMMCKKSENDTHPANWCDGIICIPADSLFLCGNGVRDLPNEMCDGNDLTGCYSGQVCGDSCTCQWEYQDPNLCGNGVRDLPDEMCDGSDLTGCLSGQSCSDSCSCVWVVTQEPPQIDVNQCIVNTCGDQKCNPACENGSTCPQDCPTPAPHGDLCKDHGGAAQFEGDVCVCPGIIDHVVICADGTKFDNPTTVQCTPNESCEAPPQEPTRDEPACRCVLTDPCKNAASTVGGSCPGYHDSCTGAECRP